MRGGGGLVFEFGLRVVLFRVWSGHVPGGSGLSLCFCLWSVGLLCAGVAHTQAHETTEEMLVGRYL